MPTAFESAAVTSEYAEICRRPLDPARCALIVIDIQQKLLPPIVLGAGSILLNAAESDEKIEVSKIVASRFGDSDFKTTTSLDLAAVVRKTANLGATYPEVVAILETALRQKNRKSLGSQHWVITLWSTIFVAQGAKAAEAWSR